MINLEVGVLNIGVSNTLTQKYLLPYIKIFHQKYPNIKIKIHTNPTFELITKVRNGLVDFIILNLPYNVPNDFEKVKLKEIHDCFMASDKFKNLKDKVIPLANLNNYPLILMATGANTRYFIDDVCAKLNITLNPEIELASYSLVTEFTKAGLGIGLLTKEYMNELEKNELFEINISPKLPSRSIGVIYLKDQATNCRCREFIKLLQENSFF